MREHSVWWFLLCALPARTGGNMQTASYDSKRLKFFGRPGTMSKWLESRGSMSKKTVSPLDVI